MAADQKALEAHARVEAARFGLDPSRFMASIQNENRWKNNRTSPAGAVGIGQIMPEWFPKLRVTKKELEANPMLGITKAAQIRAYAQKSAGGDQDLTDAFYNASPKAVNAFISGKAALPLETQNYILKNRAAAAAYGGQPYTPETDAMLRKRFVSGGGAARTTDLMKMAGVPQIPAGQFDAIAQMQQPQQGEMSPQMQDISPPPMQPPQMEPIGVTAPQVAAAPPTQPTAQPDEALNAAFGYEPPDEVAVPDWFKKLIRQEVEAA